MSHLVVIIVMGQRMNVNKMYLNACQLGMATDRWNISIPKLENNGTVVGWPTY